MAKYSYDDIVRIREAAPPSSRPGSRAWVVAVFDDSRPGKAHDRFPPGVVYSVEFEDGECIDIHESDLEETSE